MIIGSEVPWCFERVHPLVVRLGLAFEVLVLVELVDIGVDVVRFLEEGPVVVQMGRKGRIWVGVFGLRSTNIGLRVFIKHHVCPVVVQMG